VTIIGCPKDGKLNLTCKRERIYGRDAAKINQSLGMTADLSFAKPG